MNIPTSDDGTKSSHSHNLAKSQSYRGLKLLLSDSKFMAMVNSMFTYHRIQKIHDAYDWCMPHAICE
jgi:hypothetical protein